MFDFNINGLKEGSQIISSKGNMLYTVLKTFTPDFATPCKNYLNDSLWLKVKDYDGKEFSQPVQWFNAVIGANDGIHVLN